MNKKIALMLVLGAGPVMAGEVLTECMAEADDKLRLACYDRLAKAAVMNSKALLETGDPLAAKPVGTPAVTTDAAPMSSAMSKFWELGDEDKRGAFVVRTYLPNFLLPLHYTSNLNRSPSSPTHPVSPDHPNYRKTEAKLHISLRAKMAENLLLPGADLWFAYTQRSLWQIWDREDSSPFRSTDYQPEAIYVVPVPANLGVLPYDWNFRMLQVGAAHQSNGQSAPLSRSWNRVYLGAGFERGDFGLLLRAHKRLDVQSNDDNPDLTDYIGRGEVNMNWTQGVTTLGVIWRTTFHSLSRGSLQVDWTYPVFANKPAGLRWYAQLFTGYGETLLDYNHRQTSLGLGLTLFQF